MNLASIALNQIMSMFIIILIGAVCYNRIITKQVNSALSSLVLYIVNPAVIFASYQKDFDKTLLLGLGYMALLSALSFFMAILISQILIKKKNNPDYNIERIGVVYSNCGFMGIPLINALIGDLGVFYVAVYLTIFNILLWTHGLMLMTKVDNIRQLLKGLITPCIIAVFVGVFCFVFGIRLPNNIEKAVEYIGSMNTPLAMLVAGATIAQTNFFKAFKNIKLYYVTFIKLLIIPLAVVSALCLFKSMNIPYEVIMTIIIATACPTGASGTLFALRYNGNAVYSSEIFGITTLFSMLTMPAVVIVADKLIPPIV